MDKLHGYLSRLAQILDPTALVYEGDEGYRLEWDGHDTLDLGRTHSEASQAIQALQRAKRARRRI